MIPVSSTSSQPLFFFGTLMDVEILSYVLQRPVTTDDLVPAVVEGYRRVRAANMSYPILVPAAHASVEGRLLLEASPSDIGRINHYESEEYRAILERVRLKDDVVLEAWMFLAIDHVMIATNEDWDLDSWVRVHKSSFLVACDNWMADYSG